MNKQPISYETEICPSNAEYGVWDESSIPTGASWVSIEEGAIDAYPGGPSARIQVTLHPDDVPVIVVGRHAGEIPGVRVVAQENIEWALDMEAAAKQHADLWRKAHKHHAHILYQNVPGILSAVLISERLNAEYDPAPGMYREGVIVSKPGPRVAAVGKDFTFPDGGQYQAAVPPLHEAMAAVKHANGRAQCESLGYGVLRVTVDPISPFVFDHIEWFE